LFSFLLSFISSSIAMSFFFFLWFSRSFRFIPSSFAHICLYMFPFCLYIFSFWLLYWLLFVFSSSVSISLSLLLWKRLWLIIIYNVVCVVSVDHTWIYWILLFIIII
jgi:hypothetical protein